MVGIGMLAGMAVRSMQHLLSSLTCASMRELNGFWRWHACGDCPAGGGAPFRGAPRRRREGMVGIGMLAGLVVGSMAGERMGSGCRAMFIYCRLIRVYFDPS